ncbi:MAG: M20/M25/M40 family metallo-hydrolase [Bacteroidetes bacterium]|nr:M20/M25/M40 family metallo-hydrolase [Bacteroidota bacterium]
MKIRLLTALMAAASIHVSAQDSVMLRKISNEIMLHGTCYDNLRVLCKNVGHRLAGSPEAARAVKWGERAMREAGADKVWLQPVDVPHWVRGEEHLYVRGEDGRKVALSMLSIGNTEGTGGETWKAPIVMVKDMDEFSKLSDDEIKDKIIFFDYHFRQDLIFTFEGYGDAVKYRWLAPNVASSRGALAVIIRAVSTGEDDYPHTGAMRYMDTVKRHIPAVAIGNYSADLLVKKCKQGEVIGYLSAEAHMLPDMVRSYNVIGEIKGSEHPEKIVVVGGHLDSWDVGEGANDDGTGCVQSIEVIRAFKALGIRPKCTVRAVLFMNEENGLKGGLAYGDSAKARNEQHIFALETDAGGFSPRGFGLKMNAKKKAQIWRYKNLFLPYGVYDFSRDEGGADISPLEKMDVPTAGLLPDPQRYFDLHHTDNDVFENVNHRELKLGAVAVTGMVYLVSEHGLK